MRIKQISVFLENKRAGLPRSHKLIAKAGIDIRALVPSRTPPSSAPAPHRRQAREGCRGHSRWRFHGESRPTSWRSRFRTSREACPRSWKSSRDGGNIEYLYASLEKGLLDRGSSSSKVEDIEHGMRIAVEHKLTTVDKL